MESFTPLSATSGGVLIGAAAVLLMALNGRIAGISGIAGGLIRRVPGDVAWRAAFIAGLLGAPWCHQLIAPLPDITIPRDTGLLIAGGVLVGLGTRLGSGCTSGHGVCGLARFSARSLVATLTFLTTGMATVYLVRVAGVA